MPDVRSLHILHPASLQTSPSASCSGRSPGREKYVSSR